MLLQEMGGRLWRNREASCNALSDLLQGRRWSELKDKLRDIWTMTLRAADDIKESVRGAASILGKTLRNLTLRLCDPQVTPTKLVWLCHYCLSKVRQWHLCFSEALSSGSVCLFQLSSGTRQFMHEEARLAKCHANTA